MTSHTQDDAFHEIQLGGKQLAFLFMAATLVSVVIFLCGVFVGRGVRAERGATDPLVSADSAPSTTTDAPTGGVLPDAGDPTASAAPAASGPDNLTYYQRLDQSGTPREELKPAKDAAASVVPPAAAPPVATTPPDAPARQAAAAVDAPQPADGFVVQVSAVNARGEADKLVKRLSGKGYSAFVSQTGVLFRVRVGPFKTKQEADAVSARLHTEEKFSPWVTR